MERSSADEKGMPKTGDDKCISGNGQIRSTNVTNTVAELGTKMQRIHSVITGEQLNELKRRAQEAAKLNKIFSIRGCFQSVRHALRSRGWVEKLEQHQQRKQAAVGSQVQVLTMDWPLALPKRKMGETRRQFLLKCERNIMSRFVEHLPVDLLWIDRKEKADYTEQSKNPQMLINKFNRTPFTNKEGLNNFLRDLAWFYDDDVADVNFPRCFNSWTMDELHEFIDHFRLTACVAFLRWLVDKYQERGSDFVFSSNGKIPHSAIEFASKRCHAYIEAAVHVDIDGGDGPHQWEQDWELFLLQHHQLTEEHGTIQIESGLTLDPIVHSVSLLLDKLRVYWPQYAIDGYSNLWIVKPANKCRGRGIHLGNNLKKILAIVNPSVTAKSRFVIQKYIERPLTIHQTKFDIRQWFLISNIHPLMVWMYKECYLRFSSQEYTLANHHESVHLTNHAVQKKYTNQSKRDRRLPNENMWDSYTFQTYLRQMGKQHLWWDRIYPGMRKAIVGTMLVSQDYLERNPNTFELFGADFMICENFYPWLIEINSNPDLAPTTSVTARMCPQCLEDVIKVTVDRRLDAKADVGNFELIYRQVIPSTPAYMGLNLCLKGKQLSSHLHNHHTTAYYKQRKDRSLQNSQMYRQRLNMTLSSISQVHKPMPAFNATDYIERCLFQSRSSSMSNLLNGKNQSAQQAPNHASITETFTKCRKSFTQFVSTIKDGSIQVQREKLTIGSKTNSQTVKTYQTPLKRHRSCGPRLTTKPAINTNTPCHKLKFFVGNLHQQKAGNSSNSSNSTRARASRSKNFVLRPPLLTISKSADNIKDLSFKANKTTKSLSPIGGCKRSSRQKNRKPLRKSHTANRPNTGDNANNQKVKNQTINIHAVGKRIGQWNKQKEQVDEVVANQTSAPTLLLSPRYLTTHFVPLSPNTNKIKYTTPPLH